MQYVTAWGALVEQARLTQGDFVIVTAASSSVGIAAFQVARAVGATVIATTPTDFKRRDIGVRLVIKPQITADDKTVDLSLFPEVTDFEGFINYGSQIDVGNPDGTTSLLSVNEINQPVFNTRRINTKVLIRDGDHDGTAVRGEGDRLQLLEVAEPEQFHTGGEVPEANRIILSSGRCEPTVRRTCDREDVASMRAEAEFPRLRLELYRLAYDADIVLDMHCDDEALMHIYLTNDFWPNGADLAAAKWAWQNDRAAGRGADTLPGARRLFLPMHTGRGPVGVVGIDSDKPGPLLTPDQRRLLDALMDQGALAIERVHLVEDMDRVKRTMETDKLRTA